MGFIGSCEQRIRGKLVGPVQTSLSDKPAREEDQGKMMLPSPLLEGLQVGPAQLGLSIWQAPLDKRALALAGGECSELR